ncbi:MAG: hypothetical protein EOO13_09080 [Chitinophagaceae bacterium]|nr:MAG: hypothetical protein EOO13_09080 [Chitinophagaceae bacterium]
MSKDKTVNPANLPESEVFNSKDVNQHKHLADMGKPLDKNEKLNDDLKGKTDTRTSKQEGLNQDQNSGSNKGIENESDI